MDHRGFCYIGKIRSVVILQKSCNESFHNTPQGEILSAVYQHPVSDGIAKEVRTKTNEKYHDDTGEDSTDDASADTAGSISDNGSTAVLEKQVTVSGITMVGNIPAVRIMVG